MTECFVIRHAHAGTRGAASDDTREITKRGRAQSKALADLLADQGIRTILSSPFTRCVQTVEPLATGLGLTVGVDTGLAEGAGPSRALNLIERSKHSLALCSHGDVIGDTMNVLSRRGVVLDDDRVAKGSVWVLTVLDGVVTAARYLPPSL